VVYRKTRVETMDLAWPPALLNDSRGARGRSAFWSEGVWPQPR